MSEPGDVAEVGDSQPASQSAQPSPVKMRKQLPQRSVDEFWKKVRTALLPTNRAHRLFLVHHQIPWQGTQHSAS